MEENRLRAIFRGNKFATGIFNFIASEAIVDLAGYAGFDFLVFDTEHASYDVGTIERQVRAAEAAGVASLVRISHLDPYLIARVCDTGADGLLFARVSSKAEAEAMVAASKLAPLGTRGACPGSRSAHFHTMPVEEYTRRANDMAVCVMIETKQGMEEAEDILSVPGVDGVNVGKSDLAFSLGLDRGRENPEVHKIEERINQFAKSKGLGAVVAARHVDHVAAYLKQKGGPRIFIFSTETYQIGSAFRQLVERSRALVDELAAA